MKVSQHYQIIRNTLKNRFDMRNTPDICFIWIPKCAGASIFRQLRAKCGMKRLRLPLEYMAFPNSGAVTFSHVHYMSLRHAKIVSPDYDNRAFKFAISRNPYSRVVSLYSYLGSTTPAIAAMSFDEFLDECAFRRPPIGLYSRQGTSMTNCQADWVIGKDGEPICEIFKLEDLQPLSERLQQVAGITLDIGRKDNVSVKPLDLERDVLVREDWIKRINDIYARDFELFDYKKL